MKTTPLVLASLFFILISKNPTFGFTLPAPSDPTIAKVTAEEQVANAVQGISNPAVGFSGQTAGALISALTGRGGTTRGLQFKDPVLSSGVSYRRVDDGVPGGFGGNEIGGDFGIDFDIYDGLILGVIYQHTYRGSENAIGTSEHLNGDGVSFYAAKRVFNRFNIGLAYNYAVMDHKLSRAVVVDLDRDAQGFTALVGLSDRKVFWSQSDKWNWNTTSSFSHVSEDYTAQKDLDTGQFTWGGELGYDVSGFFTLSGVFSYNYFIYQQNFGGPNRDEDYWTVGPRFQFYPWKNVTLTLDFNSQEGYSNYTSYNTRLGLEVLF